MSATAKQHPPPAPGAANASPAVVVHDARGGDRGDDAPDGPAKKRAKPSTAPPPPAAAFHPASPALLDALLHPLPRNEFLDEHFRKNAVHVSRGTMPMREREALVSEFKRRLCGLDVRRLFEETSSENVFLWLRPPASSSDNNGEGGASTAPLHSVELTDPETAYALHVAGNHPAYCRAPPDVERDLVASLLGATGLGGGQYHPPHGDAEAEAKSLGGNTTLGRGEVELFVGAPSPATTRNAHNDNGSQNGGNGAGRDAKRATTGWHTDFQENFTVQLTGVKRWTLRRGRVRHPLRATTPHYARDAGVVESQLKVARLSCRAAGHPVDEVKSSDTAMRAYGYDYGENNAIGPAATVTMHPGDVLYFPSGMWHRVESLSPGVSLNVSLMGTTHASLVCEALHHLLVGTDARWREVVACRPGREDEDVARLQGLLEGVGDVVERFVREGGGARSLLPPALRRPLSAPREGGGRGEESSDDDDDDGEGDNDDASIVDAEEDDDNDDVPASAIVVDMDSFVGPEGWTAAMPPDAALARNPLASLMSMSDIAGRRDPSHASPRRRYVLNVNYAGNEMMESHLRVLLETSSSSVQSQIEGFLECEARGEDPCRDRLRKEDVVDMAPLLCLLYYGYITWNDAQQCSHT